MAGRVWQDAYVNEELDSVQVQMRVGARDDQQDAAYVGPCVVAVADGMGGHERGAVASRIALNAFAAAIGESATTLVDAVARADGAVRALSEGRWRPWAPGTTVVAAKLERGRVEGVWAGDSRAYLLGQDGVCEPLTHDHSDSFGGIEHALGAFSPRPFHLDRFSTEVAGNAGLLLCTDGLTLPFDAAAWHRGGTVGGVELVGDDVAATIAMLLTDRGLSGLVDLVSTLDASDNVTALLLRF